VPPLGYRAWDGKLVVDSEAETVRYIFCRYAELGSIRLLKQELDAQGLSRRTHAIIDRELWDAVQARLTGKRYRRVKRSASRRFRTASLYQLSGSTELSAGEPKTITGGGGMLTAGGMTASLTAGSGEPSTLLYFLLVPKEALDQPVAATPAAVNELYRTAAPLPELKSGSYELNLTRV
jgi:hypothetical protein